MPNAPSLVKVSRKSTLICSPLDPEAVAVESESGDYASASENPAKSSDVESPKYNKKGMRNRVGTGGTE